MPAIDDGGTIVFDSNAILLYLAEKTGKFLPAPAKSAARLLSWLMFVATGVGPYSGQAVHFKHFAPKDQDDYAHNRYQFEAERHYKILDDHLAKQPLHGRRQLHRSSTWRCGAGRAWCRSCSARTRFAKYPEREAADRRDHRRARRPRARSR